MNRNLNPLAEAATWVTGHVGWVAWTVAVLIALLAADTAVTIRRARRRNHASLIRDIRVEGRP